METKQNIWKTSIQIILWTEIMWFKVLLMADIMETFKLNLRATQKYMPDNKMENVQ